MPNQNQKEQKKSKLMVDKPNYRYADEVEPKLRECKKLTHDDRECFAKNLGRMVLGVQRKHDINLSKLFREAFGHTADSLYKKRKSLVTMPGEKAVPSQLRSQVRDYFYIIDALVKYNKSTADDATCRQNLILRFIADSSYESQLTIRDRMSAEFLKELRIQLDKVTEKVQSNVDLDYMYEWTRNLDPFFSLDLEDVINNSSAPCVRIAEVFTTDNRPGMVLPLCVDLTGIDIELAEDDTESKEKEKLRGAIQTALFSTYGKTTIELLGKEDIAYKLGKSGWHDKSETCRNYMDFFPKAESEWIEATGYYSYRTFVDLELRYSDYANRWEPNLFWRSNVVEYDDFLLSEIHGGFRESVHGGGGFDSALQRVHPALEIIQDNINSHTLYAVIDTSAVSSCNISLFLVNKSNWWDLFDTPFRGMPFVNSGKNSEGFKIVKEKFHDFLLSTSGGDDHKWRSVLCNTRDYGHVPAPDDSFSQLILKNLAYAPAEQRIDNLMLADAKKKYDAFEKRAAKKKLEYQTAINKFQSSGKLTKD